MSFSVSAATVAINDKDEILLIRRADNHEWQIPGGVVECGEQPFQAAQRETEEEAGIKVEILKLSGVYTHLHRGIYAFVFLAIPSKEQEQVTDETVRTPEETIEQGWFTAEEALDKVSAVFRPRIEDALSLWKNETEPSVFFRSHDGTSVVQSSIY